MTIDTFLILGLTGLVLWLSHRVEKLESKQWSMGELLVRHECRLDDLRRDISTNESEDEDEGL